ncbi:MAG: Uma2 family endonuclease [Sumerlaeia bacterium]
MPHPDHIAEADAPPYGPSATAAEPQLAVPVRRRFTRAEYAQMADLGLFDGQRVELFEGDILAMTPAGPGHSSANSRLLQVFFRLLLENQHLRVQEPLAPRDSESAPEPDLAVVAGAPGDYRDRHPEAALLVVEVSKATLAFDRVEKAQLYARMGIPEYLILNLIDNQLEYHAQPLPDSATPGGWRYGTYRVLRVGETVRLEGLGGVEIPIGELIDT